MNDLDISPAPWSAVEADKFHGEYVIDANGCTVCDLYFMNNGEVVKHGHNTIANARLTQTAPAMYKALQEVARLVDWNRADDELSNANECLWKINKLLSEIRGN